MMLNSKGNSSKGMKVLKPWTLPKTVSTDSWAQARNLKVPFGPRRNDDRSSCSSETDFTDYSSASELLNGPAESSSRDIETIRQFGDWWAQMNTQCYLPQLAPPQAYQRNIPDLTQRKNSYPVPNYPQNIPRNNYLACPPVVMPIPPPFGYPVPPYMPLNNQFPMYGFDGYPTYQLFQPQQYPLFSLPPVITKMNYQQGPSTSRESLKHNKRTQVGQERVPKEVKQTFRIFDMEKPADVAQQLLQSSSFFSSASMRPKNAKSQPKTTNKDKQKSLCDKSTSIIRLNECKNKTKADKNIGDADTDDDYDELIDLYL